MADKLAAYNQKRDFLETREPPGSKAAGGDTGAGPLCFVVQHHLASRDHYDLPVWNGTARRSAGPSPTAPLVQPPRQAPGRACGGPFRSTTAIFEGTIPKGEYGGGVVMLWDEGTWEPLGDVDEDLRRGELRFVLQGERLDGAWVLVRLAPRKGDGGKDDWLLVKERDGNARDDGGIAEASRRACALGARWTRSGAIRKSTGRRTPSSMPTCSWPGLPTRLLRAQAGSTR